MFSAWLGYYVDDNLRINCSPALAERVFAMNKPYRGDDNEEWNRLIKSNKVLMTGIDLTRTRDQEHQLQRHDFSLVTSTSVCLFWSVCFVRTVQRNCYCSWSLCALFLANLNVSLLFEFANPKETWDFEIKLRTISIEWKLLWKLSPVSEHHHVGNDLLHPIKTINLVTKLIIIW